MVVLDRSASDDELGSRLDEVVGCDSDELRSRENKHWDKLEVSAAVGFTVGGLCLRLRLE